VHWPFDYALKAGSWKYDVTYIRKLNDDILGQVMILKAMSSAQVVVLFVDVVVNTVNTLVPQAIFAFGSK
jgi:hypothetical protein